MVSQVSVQIPHTTPILLWTAVKDSKVIIKGRIGFFFVGDTTISVNNGLFISQDDVIYIDLKMHDKLYAVSSTGKTAFASILITT